ncbi:MAG: penicillin-binding transpeptidase domain-containing protein [Defluviitaleaceae bacterium]|nr:penicillin-binding transpeptidase domain-containing protein [Defluviitaleaceae bacterium]
MRNNSGGNGRRPQTNGKRQSSRKRALGAGSMMMKGKLIFFGVAASFCIMFLLGRIMLIQTVHGDDFERRAIERTANSQTRFETFHAVRGQVFDRNRNLLASTFIRDNIVIDIRRLHLLGVEDRRRNRTRKADTLEAIHTHLGIPMDELMAYFTLDPYGNLIDDTSHRIIARDVDPLVTLELMQSDVVYVFSEPVSVRSFVHPSLAPQVLGFVRGDASFGLESSFGAELAGRSGRIPMGVPGVSPGDQVRDGYSLITTIDTTIQQFAEDTARSSGIEFEAEAVSVIVMNPNTGEIIAMAQYPSFDNNHPDDVTRVTNPFLREYLLQLDRNRQVRDMNTSWNNFALSSSFEPGSIFKTVVAAAAFEERVANLSSIYFCGGYKDIHGDIIPCWIFPLTGGGHGTLTFEQALAVSCNVAFMDIAAEMGAEMFHRYLRYFGFGERTGIDLPGEASFAPLVYNLNDLRIPAQLATSGMGQGSNSTAIQNITAFASTINGGYLMQPFVVAQIVDSDGNVVYENRPTVQRNVLSRATSEVMREIMVSTVTPMGTGTAVMIEGYSIGGKTGTGQQGRREDNINSVSFMGYFPAENPMYITLVFIHRVPADVFVQGRATATHASRELIENIIRYRGIQPDGRVNFADNLLISRDGIELADFAGLDLVRAVMHLNDIGLDYVVIGSGHIIERTIPQPGQRLTAGGRVFLYMEASDDLEGLTIVPDLVGLSAATASEILASVGLQAIVIDSREVDEWQLPPSDPAPDDYEYPYDEAPDNILWEIMVYDQMPAAETRMPPGAQVRLRAN